MELAGGTILRGAYRVERVLGKGGFGITYFGQEVALERPVAIKEHFPYGCVRLEGGVQPGLLSMEDYQASRERFARESRLLAQFDHPSIVRVLTVFEESNTSYLVMDYVEGPSFQQILEQQGVLSPEQALGYLRQACQALEIVHSHGLLHRDIKPSNLLLRKREYSRGGWGDPRSAPQDDRLVLIDFGSAREATLRKATAIVSAGYSPPELYSQEGAFGPYTDIYALAATFYHLLLGQSPPDCLQRLLGAALQPHPSTALWKILERGLSVEPGERYASMADFAAALDVVDARGARDSSVRISSLEPTPSGIMPTAPQPEFTSSRLAVSAPSSLEPWPETLAAHRCWIRTLAFSPDGQTLVTGAEDKTVRIWSRTGAVATLTEHTGWVWRVLFSEDGSKLYSAGYDRHLIVWDTANWQRLSMARCADAIQCVAVWGVWMAVGTLGGKLEIRRLPDLELLHTVKLAGGVTSCSFVRGELAAVAGDDRVYLIDLQNGAIVERLKGHQGVARAVTTLSDGHLVSGGADKMVRLWDLDHGQSVPWSGHQGTILALKGCSDGRSLVSSSADKTVRLWELSGQSRELGKHAGEVTALATTTGWVASAGQDNLVRFWPIS